MPGRYLIDTNIAIAILEGELSLGEADIETFLCLTVVGELYFGAEKSRRAEANRTRVDRLLHLCPLLNQDLAIAHQYAIIKAAQQRRGRPIPENDIWIAATAKRYGLILATRDRHFEEVEDLERVAW